MRVVTATSAAIVLALVFFGTTLRLGSAQGPSCGLLQDCHFDGFYGDAGAGSGVWKLFTLSGAAGIGLHPTDAWPKGPSVWIKGNAPFDAGIYQQVRVTPGKGYHVSLPYAVVSINGAGWSPDNQVNRRIGIDPFGGTDAASPNVRWSADYFGKAKVTESIDFDEYARSETITVFIRVTNPYTDREVDVFIDTPSMDLNPSMPPMEVVEPTAVPPTIAPPTPIPTREPAPTSEPAPAESPEPTVEVVTPTLEPSPTPEKQQAVPTINATRTRAAAAQPTARATRVRVSQANTTSADAPALGLLELGLLGGIGLCGLAAGASFALVGFWLIRVRQ